jgi:hypothetical protein
VDNLPFLFITQNEPSQEQSAAALDISGENMLFQTDAALSVGDCVELRASTVSQTMMVRAVIAQKDQNIYECQFVKADDINRFRYLLLTQYEM